MLSRVETGDLEALVALYTILVGLALDVGVLWLFSLGSLMAVDRTATFVAAVLDTQLSGANPGIPCDNPTERGDMTTAELIAAGREAMARNDWDQAFALWRQADDEGPVTAQELEDFATSAWWIGRPDDCIDIRERAYAEHSSDGDTTRAGVVALALAMSRT